MSDVADAAKQDLGPMPVWVWGVMAGGAFVLYRYIQKRQVSAVANAAPVAVGTGLSPLDAGPYNITQSPALGTASSSAGAQTNAGWVAEAEAGLLGAGNDPIHILQALNDYLQGNPLSYAEQGIVNQAIAKYGLPPEGGAPLGTLAAAPTPPVPTPPAQTGTTPEYVTVAVPGLTLGNPVSLSDLARVFSTTPAMLTKYNPSLVGKATVPVGSTIIAGYR